MNQTLPLAAVGVVAAGLVAAGAICDDRWKGCVRVSMHRHPGLVYGACPVQYVRTYYILS